MHFTLGIKMTLAVYNGEVKNEKMITLRSLPLILSLTFVYSFCVHIPPVLACIILFFIFHVFFLGLQLFITLTSSIITDFKHKKYKINVFIMQHIVVGQESGMMKKRVQRGN